jgi:hypothetical protein
VPDLLMHKITEKEFSDLDLGDIRRNKRFITIIDNVINRPGQSILQQNEGWYNSKATYEFFKNEDVTLGKIQQAIQSYGLANINSQLDCVLVIHDTSNISYTKVRQIYEMHRYSLIVFLSDVSQSKMIVRYLQYQASRQIFSEARRKNSAFNCPPWATG